MLITIPKYEYEEIVVGGNLNALLYSYHKKIPLVINKLLPPHRFEVTEGRSSLELWNKLFFTLSLLGLNLLGDKTRSTRIKENQITVATKGARAFKANFKKLIIFDDEDVSGLPLPIKENEDFIVLDWMSLRCCETHSHNYFKTDDQLVNEVHFYPSERIDGNHVKIKDIVTISFLNKPQLEDFEYSDTYAKFKIINMLKTLGIRGAKGGAGNHYALKVEVEKREIRKAKMNLYKDLEHIKFIYEMAPLSLEDAGTHGINKLLQGAA